MAELRSKRLGVVLTLAEREEEKAATRLQQARAMLADERAQLAELEGYHEDYRAIIASQRQSISVQSLITYRHFLGELSRSVDAQQLKITQTDLQCQRLLQVWQQALHRKKSIEDLIARLRVEEDAVAEKRLQQVMDELTAIARQNRDANPQ